MHSVGHSTLESPSLIGWHNDLGIIDQPGLDDNDTETNNAIVLGYLVCWFLGDVCTVGTRATLRPMRTSQLPAVHTLRWFWCESCFPSAASRSA
jgi:hypothetical protein